MVRLSLVLSLSVGAMISLPVLSSNLEGGLRKKVLECNVTSGIFQQVAVYQTENGFVVRTLGDSGGTNETPLLARQWMSQKIPVPCVRSRATCGMVYRTQTSSWAYTMGSRDFTERGYCR